MDYMEVIRMKHLISLVGAPAAGKTRFANWFIKRNPVYTYLDIASLRKQWDILDEDKSIDKRLEAEQLLWRNTQETIIKSKSSVLLESTGLLHQLQPIYDFICDAYIVKFVARKEELISRIISRNNTNAQLELECLEKDLSDIEDLSCNLICTNPNEATYIELEDKIFMYVVEKGA